MKLKPIQKRKRVYQEIIERIKTAIEKGEIHPGDKLPSERALSEALSVSRTSVKEALTVLESSGVVRIRPGVGVFLVQESSQRLLLKLADLLQEKETTIVELIELRQAIEGDAAYYAASRITEEQKEHLRAVFEKLVAVEKQGQIAVEEDYQFHLAIIEAANNPLMRDVMNLISDNMIRVLTKNREASRKNELFIADVVAEHRKIYEAIINGKPDEARKAMWQHFQGVKQRHT
ncbi:FadR/GntR family transcriptional regulator [Halalkalibacterium ligniniphilum]|uniref:FadR/GntR family transcriptional regulator n=2 Tax=Halalkalibacterium ligniniphilum TaxID=1134413 RepID=UPI000346E5B7|nr:FadR/GntR family transcriptional regulator [Halalkalibacterium ligniniphilum]